MFFTKEHEFDIIQQDGPYRTRVSYLIIVSLWLGNHFLTSIGDGFVKGG